jgi:lactoylglutathione lyase
MRAFPVIYAHAVERTATFYVELLGFEEHFRLPAEGEPGYVGLRRGESELAVVAAGWPAERLGVEVGSAARFEMLVYVDDLDATIERARVAGVPVLREPEPMPWGERLGYVADPEGNPVSLVQSD